MNEFDVVITFTVEPTETQLNDAKEYAKHLELSCGFKTQIITPRRPN